MYKLTWEDKRNIHKASNQKRMTKFGPYWVIGTVLQYVDSDSTLGKLIRLNKESH